MQPVQPVQVKKSKKKAKAARTEAVASGAHRGLADPGQPAEKRQQRRKDKAPEDPGSPGGTKAAPKTHVETPVTSTNRSRGRKGDPATQWRRWRRPGGCEFETSGSVGHRGEREKWSSTAARHRAQPEAKLWGQEKQAVRKAGQMQTLNPPPRMGRSLQSMHHFLSPSSGMSTPMTNDGGMGGDADSDWSAPLVHWGHYEGPCSPWRPAAPQPESSQGPTRCWTGRRVAEDSAGGTKPAKRKKKKNKNADEDATAGAQKSEQRTEPLKPAQKKRV
ncbi:hypothetical protein CRUP_023744 [Coryphaenoides rupestris]|nr:hypothetical protein CRUP_023744 [Coryphaenoides rupestris]